MAAPPLGRPGREGRRLPIPCEISKMRRFLGVQGRGSRQQENQEQDMVKIRLSRGGAKKRPFYHIVVTDSRNCRDGRYIERIGYFNPIAAGGEKRLEVDAERVDHWMGQGAQLSDRVKSLMKESQAAK